MASDATEHPDQEGRFHRFQAHLRTVEGPVREIGRQVRRYGQVLTDPKTPHKQRAGYAALGVLVVAAVLVRFLYVYALLLVPFTPSTASLRSAKSEQPTVVLSADGEEIVRYRRLNREWVTLDQVSPHVVDALIATEDHRFYDHNGVDIKRLFGATFHTLTGDLQGASTLTMQLARNLYPDRIGRSASLTRKLKEAITAVKIEAVYEKDEILETYLNTVPFLYNAFGIEMAARTYFGKSAEDLDVLESATLVGMLKGTWYYNPVRHPERARARRNVVLAQMAKRDRLAPDEYAALREESLDLDFEVQPMHKSRAPHFTEHVRRWLSGWADEHGYNIYTDGLVVRTTLDMDLQEMALQAAEEQGEALQAVADVEWGSASFRRISTSTGAYASQRRRVEPFSHFWSARRDVVEDFIRSSDRFKRGLARGAAPEAMLDSLRADGSFMDSLRAAKTRLEVGFAAIDPHTGHVKAWVGSRNFYKDQYDHVVLARRQPGSTFKPFVYGAALEQGFSPEDRFRDAAVEIPLGGGQVWRPTNADGVSGRELTLREGLMLSKNTITAQVMHEVGPNRVAALARDLGIQSKLEKVPSLALGTSEVTLLEMVSAYSTIASGGIYRAPLFVTRVEAPDGTVLAAFETTAERVMEEETALTLLDMLRGVVDGGTGQGLRSRFGIRADVAGKTGTTQDNADGWFLLMHPELVAGAWVGFNDRRVTFRSDYWGQGAHNALFVVGDFYRQALRSGALSGRAEFPPPPRYEREREDGNLFDRMGRWFGRTLGRIGDAVRGDAPEREGREERRPEERRGGEPREERRGGEPREERRRERAEANRETDRKADRDRHYGQESVEEAQRRASEEQRRIAERLRVLRERELKRMEEQRKELKREQKRTEKQRERAEKLREQEARQRGKGQKADRGEERRRGW